MSSQPFLSIILPCRNEKDQITASLSSIFGQVDLPARCEVIVADGLSEDGTREILRRLATAEPRLQVIDNPEGIVSTGLNAALRVAKGDVIIRMDAHTQYAPDYVRSCLDTLATTGADNVGGPWIARGTGVIGQAIAAAFQSRFAVGTSRGHNPHYEGPVDTVYLGCWRREVFDRIGHFDEELVRNQDDELNLRLTRSGGRIWQSPRIRSWYRPRNSLGALFNQYKQYGYWKIRVIQKHGRPASVRHLIPAASLLSGAVLLLASIWSPPAATALVLLCGAYAGGLIVISAAIAANRGWKLFPLLPAVLACYHASYGYGFLRGVADFALIGRTPRRAFTNITRTSEPR